MKQDEKKDVVLVVQNVKHTQGTNIKKGGK